MKKNIGICLSINFSIRYLLRSEIITELLKVYNVTVFISWEDEDLYNELKNLGCDVTLIPKPKYSRNFSRNRSLVNRWFENRVLKTYDSWHLERCMDARFNKQTTLIRKLRDIYHYLLIKLPLINRLLFSREEHLFISDTNLNEYTDFITKYDLSFIFTLTPFHIQELLLLKAFEKENVPIISSILSFDNPSKRGFIPLKFYKVMVWNDHNKNIIEKMFPYMRKDKIVTVGPVQFDFYYKEKYTLTYNEWLEKHQIVKNKKIILYSAGPSNLFPNEFQFIEHINSAIENKLIDDAVIIFRKHPLDSNVKWKPIIDRYKNVVYSDVWGGKDSNRNKYDNISSIDIMNLKADLMYSDIHVNLCSTMTIDGAIFEKPQIAPAYDMIIGNGYGKHIKNIYSQEHFIDIIKSGGLSVASSSIDLVDFINMYFKNPSYLKEERKEMVNILCKYTDGNSYSRVVKELIAK